MDLFKELGCEVFHQNLKERWGLFKKDGCIIQVVECPVEPLCSDKKIASHIGFISDNPEAEVERIKKWAEEKGLEFVQGSWSDLEFWFDLPEFFNDFVIEIMNRKILE